MALRPAVGGCINETAVVEADDDVLFLKWNERPLLGQFEAEAAGLRALSAAESELRIPEVIGFSDEPGQAFLLLEYLDSAPRGAEFDRQLGVGLAQLHRMFSERGFGFDLNGFCGATPQPNPWTSSWLEFYAHQRLGHQIELAAARGMGGSDLDSLHALVDRLGEWIDDSECPALIHGDLWSGNLHVDERGRPALIDPAAYYGHREAELGMMALFGGFDAPVWEAYEEAWPLDHGWRDRIELYSLYHILNHYNLFGGGYGNQAVSIARRYVG